VKVFIPKLLPLVDTATVRRLTRNLSVGSLLLGLPLIGFGQSVTLSIGSGSATAGATVSVPITVASSGGAQTAGLQWSFSYSSDITSVSVVAGSSATDAGKTITCSGTTCLVLGFNTTAIADGTVATATFQIASNPSNTSILVQITGVVASTATGTSIPATGGSGTITLPVPPPTGGGGGGGGGGATVSVGVSPLTAGLSAAQSKQFIATVTGNANTAVTWSMNPAVGTLTNGLYTAPSVISAAQSVTITATSVADVTKSASATVQLAAAAPASVSLSPLTASLTASQSKQFTAIVSGSSNTSVTWSLAPSVGSLSSSGLYTAPSGISTVQSVTITATSVADPTKSATATVQLNPTSGGVGITVSPSNATLTASQSKQFTAIVTGNGTTSVTWSMTPSVGTLSNGLYTAPSVINNTQLVTVTASSVSDATKYGTATVQLMASGGPPAGAVTITSPTSQPTFTSAQHSVNLAGNAPPNTTQVVWATDEGIQGQATGTATWAANGITLRNGANRITVTARDTAGNPSSATITVVFSAPTIVTTSLPNAQLGQSYSSKLAVLGGTPPLTWSAVSTPDGITVSQDGKVTGTPSTAGTFTINLMVQDSLQVAASGAVTLRVDSGLVVLSAASLKPGPVAPSSMVTVFGGQLADGTQSAATQPLPTTLGNCTLTITDVNGVARPAGLYYISPNQINFSVPADTAAGTATISVTNGTDTRTLGTLTVATTAPGLFFLNADGLAAAGLTRVNGAGTTYQETAQLDNSTNLFVPVPVDLGSDTDQVYLTLYGTGVRNRQSLASVQVLIAGMPVTADYAGPSGSDGVDIVRVLLPKGLRGTGMATVVVTVNAVSSNAVRVQIK
jgi:trimeric autotransporter adhesin